MAREEHTGHKSTWKPGSIEPSSGNVPTPTTLYGGSGLSFQLSDTHLPVEALLIVTKVCRNPHRGMNTNPFSLVDIIFPFLPRVLSLPSNCVPHPSTFSTRSLFIMGNQNGRVCVAGGPKPSGAEKETLSNRAFTTIPGTRVEKLVFLGTCSAVPSPGYRNTSGMAFILSTGKVFLVDCGEASQHQIMRSSSIKMK